jgi:hypothetical protein
MMGRRIQMRRLTQILVLIVLGIFWGASNEAGAANEQRCSELGANCVCSEPLNTSTYTSPTESYFDPADTTVSDKQCTRLGGFAGVTLEDGAGFRYVVESSGEMLTSLPPGHLAGLNILRTKTEAEGNPGGGGQFIGHNFSGGNPTARRSFRFYMYWSPTYTLYDDGVCLNSAKILQFGQPPMLSALLSGAGGNYVFYGWTGWNANPDCCLRGPGGNASWGTYDPASIQGRWFRFEFIATNVLATGPITTLTVYMKNITDNRPEVLLINTTVPTTQPVGDHWTSTLATTLKPASGLALDEMYIDAFRNGTCAGYKGFSHLLLAAWNTDAGQRIGAAVEVEGGTRPPPPSNLIIITPTEGGQ